MIWDYYIIIPKRENGNPQFLERGLCFFDEHRTDAPCVKRGDGDGIVLAVLFQRQTAGRRGHGSKQNGLLALGEQRLAQAQLEHTRCTDGQIGNGNGGQEAILVLTRQKRGLRRRIEHGGQRTVGDVVCGGEDLGTAVGGDRVVPRIVSKDRPACAKRGINNGKFGKSMGRLQSWRLVRTY